MMLYRAKHDALSGNCKIHTPTKAGPERPKYQILGAFRRCEVYHESHDASTNELDCSAKGKSQPHINTVRTAKMMFKYWECIFNSLSTALLFMQRKLASQEFYFTLCAYERPMHANTPNNIKKKQCVYNLKVHQCLNFPHLQLIVSLRLIILTTRPTSTSIQLASYGVCDVRQLLLLFLEVFGGCGGGVLLEPVGGFLDSLEKLDFD